MFYISRFVIDCFKRDIKKIWVMKTLIIICAETMNMSKHQAQLIK